MNVFFNENIKKQQKMNVFIILLAIVRCGQRTHGQHTVNEPCGQPPKKRKSTIMDAQNIPKIHKQTSKTSSKKHQKMKTFSMKINDFCTLKNNRNS